MSKTLSAALILVLACGTGCRKADNQTPAGTPAATPAASPAAGAATPAAAPGSAAPAPPTAPAPPPVPAAPVPEKLPEVVARVNNEDVKKTDFDMLVSNVERNNGPIPADRRNEILRRVLDELVTYTVLKQAAQSRNITATDAEVEEQIQNIRKSARSEAAFQNALKEQKMTLQRLRADAKTQIAIGKMMDAEAASTPAVTDAEAKDYYDKNPERFKQPEMVRASHILILVDPKADDETRKQARTKIDALLVRVKGGEDFANVARESSQDGSAPNGGDLDFFPREKMVPEFADVAFKMKVGEISGVVTTQFGHHIIKTTDRKPAGSYTLAEVNDRLKAGLTQQKKQQRAQEFIAQLRQKSKIEVLI